MKKFFISSILEEHDDFLIDLDNTLYDEKLYLFEAYKQIGLFFEHKYSVSGKEIEGFLKINFESCGRYNLFDSCLRYFCLPQNSLFEMLEILRHISFKSPIRLFEYSKPLISKILNNDKRVFIVTNGNYFQQRNKVNNIDWLGLKDSIYYVYANTIKAKPHKDLYDYLCENYKITRPIFIGDSNIDEEFAYNCDMPFFNVKEILNGVLCLE